METPDQSRLTNTGPEPEANQPGHHPTEEQDQPPLDDFAAKFGIAPTPSEDEEAPSPSGPSSPPERTIQSPDGATYGGTKGDGPGADAGRRSGGPTLPAPVRVVWVVTARYGVLPALAGVRTAAGALERAVRRTL